MAKRAYIHNAMTEKTAWCGRPLDEWVPSTRDEDEVTCPGCKRNLKRHTDKKLRGPLPATIRRQQRLVAQRKIALEEHYNKG